LKEGRIRTQFHFAEGRITRETMNHFKEKYASVQNMLENSAGQCVACALLPVPS
jgi:hypothetical protein